MRRIGRARHWGKRHKARPFAASVVVLRLGTTGAIAAASAPREVDETPRGSDGRHHNVCKLHQPPVRNETVRRTTKARSVAQRTIIASIAPRDTQPFAIPLQASLVFVIHRPPGDSNVFLHNALEVSATVRHEIRSCQHASAVAATLTMEHDSSWPARAGVVEERVKLLHVTGDAIGIPLGEGLSKQLAFSWGHVAGLERGRWAMLIYDAGSGAGGLHGGGVQTRHRPMQEGALVWMPPEELLLGRDHEVFPP
mmetsp:Transcript_73651/g.204771  ORF Transcript_73651/g.204771 Transcript_73651/m.204771 type:complete len:253 (-) Transcript_73651:444-1202(-)